MIVDWNTILQASLVAIVLGTGKTLWRTVGVVERLDERTKQHGERIEQLESRAA